MIRQSAIVVALLATPAFAQDQITIGKASPIFGITTITLQDSDAPGAAAEVLIHDANMNSQQDNGDYLLSWRGLDVIVDFTHSLFTGDTFRVEVPPGYIAVPPEVAAGETTTERVLIYRADDVGM